MPSETTRTGLEGTSLSETGQAEKGEHWATSLYVASQKARLTELENG